MVLSSFLPAVQSWFTESLGQPTAPQREGWPAIAAGRHVLLAAPTGTGKTLAAFLWALDGLLRQGEALPDATAVLYISPLRALSNDVHKNLVGPLAAIRERDPSLPELRVQVRTGDTTAKERAAMTRRAPHVLVTTPESLFILLTSEGGRMMLRAVRTVIVDEIHALCRDKRGSHLALSLERLEALVADTRRTRNVAGALPEQGDLPWLQRIGLSATQKPLERVARLLVGTERSCELVDSGHLRRMELDVLVPDTPLSAVCSHEQWGELYRKMAELVRAHRTTLVFVPTRKLAERLSARLSEELDEGVVGCHHGSLSKETRLEAETKLKSGDLSVLVATASLELGIDIGDVDLVLQVGAARSIATLLQRVGRAGHGVHRLPKGRLIPLTLDEAVEAAALLKSVREGLLDATPEPPPARDILAQQIVAACVAEPWDEDVLFNALRRAWPYRDLDLETFRSAVELHTGGRGALLHRDGVGGRLLATRRARLPAFTSGGAIPDTADYRVVLQPEGTFVGTLNEDFAVEAFAGDIFQLGNTAWRILKIEPGVVRVADAAGQPPTLPFWLGEAPSRTRELSEQIGLVREQCVAVMSGAATSEVAPQTDALPEAATGDATGDAVEIVHDKDGVEERRASVPLEPAVVAGAAWLAEACGLAADVGEQVARYLHAGAAALGAMPTQKRVVAERFFDETGGMQLVLHSPFGGRINRAWGLALRKTFCRGFGFELQAAANEEAILISLGPHHSFPLEDVFRFLHPNSAHKTLTQACLAAPMFQTRWRWNATRSLALPRTRNGKRVPAPLLRMRADDLLVQAFPQVMACGENLPAGDLPVPLDHVLVGQTVEDCLTEAMDVDGLLALLTGIVDETVETRAADLPEPSPLAQGILSAQPYSFLDDAPLEERRTQAVLRRRGVDAASSDELGALDPDAVARVREQAWPRPRDAEEVHEVLTWMGYVTDAEAAGWQAWLDALAVAGRVVREDGRWFATEAARSGVEMVAGRLEALGPVFADEDFAKAQASELGALEAAGTVLRTRLEGRAAWCNRRLLARIHRDTLERLREQIKPVSATDLLRFLVRWNHVGNGQQLVGPRGVLEVVRQLAGMQAPVGAWEAHILPARVAGYRRRWLDELMLSGQVAWGRLWGTGAGTARNTPVTLMPREDLDEWLALATLGDSWSVKGGAGAVLEVLAARGPCFPADLGKHGRLLANQVDTALADLVGLGLVTCDAFAGLRALLVTRARSGRRRGAPPAAGRWSLLARGVGDPPEAEFVARQLLRRWGIVFRKLLERERLPVPWRDLLFVLRRMEVRGEVRGGRFVEGFHGEQYALPEAVSGVREARRRGASDPDVTVVASDPLNLRGILTPDARVAASSRQLVAVVSSAGI